MGLYRPNDLSLCYLKGMWGHFFVGDRMRANGLFEPHIGTLFGKSQVAGVTRRTVGAITKVNRKGQKFDADGLGSDCGHHQQAGRLHRLGFASSFKTSLLPGFQTGKGSWTARSFSALLPLRVSAVTPFQCLVLVALTPHSARVPGRRLAFPPFSRVSPGSVVSAAWG